MQSNRRGQFSWFMLASMLSVAACAGGGRGADDGSGGSGAGEEDGQGGDNGGGETGGGTGGGNAGGEPGGGTEGGGNGGVTDVGGSGGTPATGGTTAAGGTAPGSGGAAGVPGSGGSRPAVMQPPKYTMNFDAETVGEVPGGPWSGKRGDVKVDETRAFSGKRSLRVFLGPSNFGESTINFATRQVLPGPKKSYYLRFMLWMDSEPKSQDFGHYDMVSFNGSFKGATQTMFGFYSFGAFAPSTKGSQKVQIYGNVGSQTADCSKSAPLALIPKKWQCVELKIDEAELLNYGVSIDGTEISAFSFPFDFTGASCVPGQDPTKGNWYIPEISGTRIGYRHVFQLTNPMALWFDDVAWSDKPIGCPKMP